MAKTTRQILELGHGAGSVPFYFEVNEKRFAENTHYTGIDSPAAVEGQIYEARGKKIISEKRLPDAAAFHIPQMELELRLSLSRSKGILEHRRNAGYLEQHTGAKISFEDRDAANLPNEWKGRFHTVFAKDFFRSPSIPNVKRLVDEAHRVLAKGGHLVITETVPVGREYLEKEHAGLREIGLGTDKAKTLPHEVRMWIALAEKSGWPTRVFAKK